MNIIDIKRIKYKAFFIVFISIMIIGGVRIYDDIENRKNNIITTENLLKNEVLYIYNKQINILNNSFNKKLTYISKLKNVTTALKYNKKNILKKVSNKFTTMMQDVYLSSIKVNISNNKDNKKIINTYSLKNNKLYYDYYMPIYMNKELIGQSKISIDISYLIKQITLHIQSIHNNISNVKINIHMNDIAQNKHIFINDNLHSYMYDIKIFKNIIDENIAYIFCDFDISKEYKNHTNFIYKNILKPIIVLLVLLLLTNLLFNYILKQFIILNEEKNKKNKELEQYKLSIITQSKNAQMGEMIENIAHQWRQPLSIISTAISGMILKKEAGIKTEDSDIRIMYKINTKVQFLSKTIDTFRNYLIEDKLKVITILQDEINQSLDIIEATLNNYHIKLINKINEYDDIKITLIKGELSQVIINLIKNAKDVIIEKRIKNKYIEIDLHKSDSTVQISIQDNAGGVAEDIIEKIFDPYFTTKHKTQGTGLGLYMSKNIVENSLNGTLKVSNNNDGAIFIIELPLI